MGADYAEEVVEADFARGLEREVNILKAAVLFYAKDAPFAKCALAALTMCGLK